jgi:hypothetical protein
MFQGNRAHIRLAAAGDVMEVAIVDPVRAGGERFAVPGPDAHPAHPDVVDIARDNLVAFALAEHHAILAQIPDDASGHANFAAAGDMDAIAPAGLQAQALEHDMRHLVQRHQRRFQHRGQQFIGRLFSRRQQIDALAGHVQDVFARAGQFFENIEKMALPGLWGDFSRAKV